LLLAHEGPNGGLRARITCILPTTFNLSTFHFSYNVLRYGASFESRTKRFCERGRDRREPNRTESQDAAPHLLTLDWASYQTYTSLGQNLVIDGIACVAVHLCGGDRLMTRGMHRPWLGTVHLQPKHGHSLEDYQLSLLDVWAGFKSYSTPLSGKVHLLGALTINLSESELTSLVHHNTR
jgi:hypothetical protein